MNNTFGLYLHIPFCVAKCAYCAFYSAPAEEQTQQAYVDALCRTMAKWQTKARGKTVASVFFGGGTPSVLSPEQLISLLDTAKRCFSLEDDCEITLEANPGTVTLSGLTQLRQAGFNRISLGMQTAVEKELSAVGRIHSLAQVRQAVADARRAGFDNLSLDLMLGLPGQTADSLAASLRTALSLGPDHLSVYCLSLEEDTPLYWQKPDLPDDDTVASFYLQTCRTLREAGFERYEISNFSRYGRVSRHNLRYWRLGDYLGLGPAAHSLWEGKRFSYPEDLTAFLAGGVPTPGEDWEPLTEYVMLSLRLSEGIDLSTLRRLAGPAVTDMVSAKLQDYVQQELCISTYRGFALTDRGALLSNQILSDLLLLLEPNE